MSPTIRNTLGLLLLATSVSACGETAETSSGNEPQSVDGIAADIQGRNIITMCTEQGNDKHDCMCANTKLREAVDTPDFRIYDRIAAGYLAARQNGREFVAAWDKGVAATASGQDTTPSQLQRQMNPVGKAHREAIKACEA